jgi:hypothetical protein
MHLTSRQTFLLLALSVIACRDTNAPTIDRQYVLNDINGRALPTYFAITPGPTTTIVTGSLALDKNGEAFMLEERQQSDGSITPFISIYNYKISGNQIVFSMLQPCPANANCVAPPTGTISPSTGRIALEVARFDTESIIYDFQPLLLD